MCLYQTSKLTSTSVWQTSRPCFVSVPGPPCPAHSLPFANKDARPFPSSVQPAQPNWLEAFNEFLIQLWLWKLANYWCQGLAFLSLRYQRIVTETSLGTAGLPEPHIIIRPCWLRTIKALKTVTPESTGTGRMRKTPPGAWKWFLGGGRCSVITGP